MDFCIIGAPISLGARDYGTEKAFTAFCEFGMERLIPEGDTYREISLEAMPASGEDKSLPMYKEQVLDMADKVRTALLEAYSGGGVPLVIGGDHSIGLGSVAATGEFYGEEETAVVWIDAHTDINTEKSSESGRIHGMSLASVLGLCEEIYVGENRRKIKGENIFFIGTRSVDCGEWDIIKKVGATVYGIDEIRQNGLDKVLLKLSERIKGKKIHISFDVDVLDPEVYKSSGYIIDNGLFPDEVKKIVGALCESGEPALFECVEYLPAKDTEGKDISLTADIIKDSMKKIKRKRLALKLVSL